MVSLDTIRNDPRRRNLAVLAGIAVLTVVLAVLALMEQARETAPQTISETFFPGLPSQIRSNDIAQVQIVSKKGTVDLMFKPEKGWVVANHDDYPAAFEQLNQTVIGMAALQTIERKTARADWLHYIGLDAPPRGNGTLITLSNEKGDVLASLIAGKSQDIGDPSGAIGLFVRKPDTTQSWLVRSVFEPKSDPSDWLDKDVMGVDRARIQETDVDPANGASYAVRRAQPSDASFALVDVPKGRQAADGAADGVAAAIVGFTFDDVRPARDFDFSDPTHSTRVVTKTFDGLVVTVQIVQQGTDDWATLSAEGAPGKADAQKEAREIDAHATGWAYKLPAYKGQLFMTSLESLLKPVGGAAPAQTPPAQ